jgi:hypothetical protein
MQLCSRMLAYPHISSQRGTWSQEQLDLYLLLWQRRLIVYQLVARCGRPTLEAEAQWRTCSWKEDPSDCEECPRLDPTSATRRCMCLTTNLARVHVIGWQVCMTTRNFPTFMCCLFNLFISTWSHYTFEPFWVIIKWSNKNTTFVIRLGY